MTAAITTPEVFSLAVRLPLELVDPNPANPREHLREIDALADNIRTFGLLQPITVRPVGERYELIGGHRRRAAYLLLQKREPDNPDWHAIAAVLKTADDAQAYLMLLSSQLHSRKWQPREEAAALERLALQGMSLKQIGAAVQHVESWVSKRLRVYADSVLSGYVQSGALPAAVAEEFLTVLDVKTKKKLAEQAARGQWTKDQARGERRRLRADLLVSEVERLTRALLDALGSTEPQHIPLSLRRDLQLLRGRIEVLSEASPKRKAESNGQK